jgi:hypothetical protein
LSSPINGNTTETLRPTFSWGSIAGATGYVLKVSRYSSFSTNIISQSVGSNSFTPSTSLPTNTKLYWKVQTKAINGPSAWSQAQWFVLPNPPSVPTGLLPASGSLVTNYKPRLDWSDSKVPANTTFLKYHVQVSTDSGFSMIVLDKNVEGDVTHSYLDIESALLPNKTYYWHVKGINTLNASSIWSSTRSFRTAILAPTIIGPSSTLNLRPTFSWNSVEGATSYSLAISKYSSFSSLVLSTSTKGTTFTPTTNLPANVTLYWRVRASGGNGPSVWSTVQQLSMPNPPSIPSLISPANNVLVITNTPSFDWSTSSVPGSTSFDHYQLQVSSSSSFIDVEVDKLISGDAVGASKYTLNEEEALLPNKLYFWRVRSTNTKGEESVWSTARSFRTAIVPPVLISPTGPINVSKPAFNWNSVEGATGYTIKISKSPSFSTSIVSVSVGTNTYTPTINLPVNVNLYWKIQAKGINGPVWSQTSTFFIVK